MNATKKKIRITSTVLMAFALALFLYHLSSSIYDPAMTLYLLAHFWEEGSFSSWVYTLERPVFVAVYGYASYILFRVRKEETPFSARIVLHLKIFSVVLFFVFCSPYLIVDIAALAGIQDTSYVSGLDLPLALFDTNVAIAFMISAALYGLAQIFKYGILLQKDSNEIV